MRKINIIIALLVFTWQFAIRGIWEVGVPCAFAAGFLIALLKKELDG